MNEEWFGIAGKTPPRRDGLYDVQPREAYYLLQQAFRLDPYAPTTSRDAISAHFQALEPSAFKVFADVGRATADTQSRLARISDLRFEFGTLTSGGTGRNGRGPTNLTSDHLQSLYLGVEAQPASNLRFETAVNVLGNVPGNYIDPIRFETRGRTQTADAEDPLPGVDLSPLNRLQIYRASFEWRTKQFDLEGFYRTGHYHWAFEGDFFGIYPEANYGPNLDLYNGLAPIGVSFTGKRQLEGLKVVAGPQVFWGANPAIFAKYSRPMGAFRFDIVHQEDVAPLPASAVAQSQAVPEQLTRKTGLHLGYARGENFTFSVGGLWAGTPRIGQTYTYTVDAEEGELSYLDSGYHVLSDEIRMIDTFGGKARITGRIGKLFGWAQGAYKGLVADGGWENWLPGTKLGESGRGNQMSAWGGARLVLGNVTLGTSGLWQKPLIGPNPNLGAQFDGDTSVFYPGIRSRNFLQDPFAVLDNRETYAGEVMLVWDPTPGTYFFQWDNNYREDAALAGSLHFTYKHQPTSRDASFGFLADGTLFAFPGAPPAQDIWEVSTRIVSNVGGWNFLINGYVGNGQARGVDDRVIFRKGAGLKATYRTVVIDSWVKLDDWGPYDFHRDFNLTFPVQTYLDISAGLKRTPPPRGVAALRCLRQVPDARRILSRSRGGGRHRRDLHRTRRSVGQRVRDRHLREAESMRPVTLFAALALAACDVPPAEYVYGTQLLDLRFDPVSSDVGVYPDTSVMIDPDNPFRSGIVGDGPVRFDALDAGPVVGFYAFATALAIIPYGENQWYTANQLHAIYDRELVAEPEDLGLVRDLAIRGYQTTLDEFPDTSFTFDATGRFQFDLLAPAIQGILALGGTPQNGWTLVEGPDGILVAVQSGGKP